MCFDIFTDCLEIYRLFADIQTVFFSKKVFIQYFSTNHIIKCKMHVIHYKQYYTCIENKI